MAESYHNEHGLKKFLVDAYTHDGVSVRKKAQPDGSLMATTTKRSWRMVERTHVSPDDLKLDGRQVVFKLNPPVWHPVWATSYHVNLADHGLQVSVWGFHSDKVISHPDPNFPVCGEQGLEDGTYRYEYASLMQGHLTVARFAVRDAIIYKPSNSIALEGFQIGGWII